MRIVLACDAPSEHLFPLPVAWSRLGHTVDVVMDRDRGRFGSADQFRGDGPTFHALEGTRPGGAALAIDRPGLRRLLRGADAVVVGGYTTRTARTVLALPRGRRPPTVLHAERSDHRTSGVRRRIRDAWIRTALGRIDAVWPMSRAGATALTALGGIPTVLAPYPLPRPAMPPAPRAVEPLRVAVIGTLTPRKRPLLALEAVRRLTHRRALVATFVGAGPLHAEVLSAARGLPVDVVERMPRQGIDALLGEAHVLLHPSAHDGWGMVVAEAVAHGAAVVATPTCDAASELATVVPTVRLASDDPDALAEAVAAAADDLMRGGSQAAGRALTDAETRFGVEAIAARTLADLERLVDR